jgi:mono/diheme cytochrome c family protein
MACGHERHVRAGWTLRRASAQRAASRRLLIAGILIASNTFVWAQDPDKGRAEFLSKCAECHGADGKGAGPKSSKLKIKPADLTVLARRNKGVFSPDAIVETVDGRSAIRHRRAMPIWGCRQGPPPGPQAKAHKSRSIDSLLDIACDPEQVIRSRIRNIVEYLGQIQEK